MMQLIEVVSGAGLGKAPSAPSEAVARYREYRAEVTGGEGPAAQMAMQAGVVEPVFRKEVFDKFVAPATQGAYWSAQPREKERLAQAQAAARMQGQVAKSEAEHRKEFEADAARAREALKSGMDEAQKKNTDMTVFGIRLGEVTSLPSCSPRESGKFVDSPPSEMCQVTAIGGEMADLSFLANALEYLTQSLSITGALQTPGIAQTTVRLPASKCASDWADCKMVVFSKGGYALAVEFLTTVNADDADRVERHLVAKYHDANPDRSTVSKCTVSYRGTKLGTSDVARNRIWKLPGLNVLYSPYGSPASCAFGLVHVETTAFRALLNQAEKARDDAQPKM